MATTFAQPFELEHALGEDLKEILRRRKVLILVVLVATIVSAYLALYLVSEQYEAHARLLVKLGRENTEVPITVEKGGVFSSGVQKEEINSYIQLLGSRAIIESAVDRVGVERFYPEPVAGDSLFGKFKFELKHSLRWVKQRVQDFLYVLDIEKEIGKREGAILGVESSLKVERERDSNVIGISLRLPDPQLAKDVVAAMLEFYMERHVELRRDVNIREVFDNQAAQHRKQLETLQKEIASIKEEYDLSSISEQRIKMLARMHDLKRQSDQDEGELISLRSQQTLLQSKLAGLPKTTKSAEVVGPSPHLKPIKERLVELQVERIRASGKYAKDSPTIATLDEEIAEVEALLKSEEVQQTGDVTYSPDPLRTAIERDLEQVEFRIAGLTASVGVNKQHADAIELSLKRLNVGEDKIHMAEMERGIVEEEYLSYAKRRGEAQIDEELDVRRVANVAVLSAPSVGYKPVYPPKLLLLGIACIAGVLLGIGLALVLEWNSDVIHGPEELARIPHLPLLGVFHIEESKAQA
jgi:uncharacterized protein involved in exopolysaccharide biosynthesis